MGEFGEEGREKDTQRESQLFNKRECLCILSFRNNAAMN